MKQVLFLCTGNYYRSRYAEILFNELVKANHLEWKAFSRGLKVIHGKNPGNISIHAIEALNALGIEIHDKDRKPVQVKLRDLKEAALVIAVKKDEHESIIMNCFPDWHEKIIYWNIHDIDFEEPIGALKRLEFEIKKLLKEIS